MLKNIHKTKTQKKENIHSVFTCVYRALRTLHEKMVIF